MNPSALYTLPRSQPPLPLTISPALGVGWALARRRWRSAAHMACLSSPSEGLFRRCDGLRLLGDVWAENTAQDEQHRAPPFPAHMSDHCFSIFRALAHPCSSYFLEENEETHFQNWPCVLAVSVPAWASPVGSWTEVGCWCHMWCFYLLCCNTGPYHEF